MSLEVFISHSARDVGTAEALIELIRAATNIPPDKIRCSSVDGYRLAGGVTTDEQLKREVREATCFVGLITPASLNSHYVLFELGARWGAQLHFIPLLAGGTTRSDLRSPLSGLNALTCSVTAQLHQLVSELAQKLGRALANAATYERHLQRLVLIASQGNTPDANILLGQQIESDEAERLSEPSSEAAHELLELVRKEPERDARGLVEIADQLRPGEIHFFPKLQYAGKPLTAKSRLFRQGVDELVTQGWLFPPEEHPATNSRTYEYRGDTVLSKTVIIASEVSAPSGKRSSPYPAAVPVSGHPGIVLSPYARSTGLCRCPRLCTSYLG